MLRHTVVRCTKSHREWIHSHQVGYTIQFLCSLQFERELQASIRLKIKAPILPGCTVQLFRSDVFLANKYTRLGFNRNDLGLLCAVKRFLCFLAPVEWLLLKEQQLPIQHVYIRLHLTVKALSFTLSNFSV